VTSPVAELRYPRVLLKISGESLAGDKGFGYDPLFRPDGFNITFGQMSADEKHGLPPQGRGLSHRARAFMKLADACLSRR